jgi:phage head maturation protease
VVERAWIEGGAALARLRFPAAGTVEEADRLFALVEQGIVRSVSAGYTVEKVRVIAPEKVGEIEKRIVERWTPHEISFVTIPADAGAQVRGEPDAPLYPIEIVGCAVASAFARMRMRQRMV